MARWCRAADMQIPPTGSAASRKAPCRDRPSMFESLAFARGLC